MANPVTKVLENTGEIGHLQLVLNAREAFSGIVIEGALASKARFERARRARERLRFLDAAGEMTAYGQVYSPEASANRTNADIYVRERELHIHLADPNALSIALENDVQAKELVAELLTSNGLEPNEYLEQAEKERIKHNPTGERRYLVEAAKLEQRKANPNPEVFRRCGLILMRLSKPDEAREHWERAIAATVARENLHGVAEFFGNIGVCCAQVANDIGAVRHTELAIRSCIADGHKDSPLHAALLDNLGTAEGKLGRFVEADNHLAQAVELLEGQQGHALDFAQALNDRAELKRTQIDAAQTVLPDFTEVFEMHQRALAMRQRHALPEDPVLIESHGNSGYILWRAGEHEGALAHFNAAVEAGRAGPATSVDHPSMLSILNNRAMCLADTGEQAQARRDLENAVDIATLISGADHPLRIPLLKNLAKLERDPRR